MTNAELDAIRKRAEAATAGPWHGNTALRMIFAKRQSGDPEGADGDRPIASIPLALDNTRGILGNRDADAAFIAHSREDIPALLDELQRLRDGLRDLRAFLVNGEIVSVFNLLGQVDRLLSPEAEPASEPTERAV